MLRKPASRSGGVTAGQLCAGCACAYTGVRACYCERVCSSTRSGDSAPEEVRPGKHLMQRLRCGCRSRQRASGAAPLSLLGSMRGFVTLHVMTVFEAETEELRRFFHVGSPAAALSHGWQAKETSGQLHICLKHLHRDTRPLPPRAKLPPQPSPAPTSIVCSGGWDELTAGASSSAARAKPPWDMAVPGPRAAASAGSAPPLPTRSSATCWEGVTQSSGCRETSNAPTGLAEIFVHLHFPALRIGSTLSLYKYRGSRGALGRAEPRAPRAADGPAGAPACPYKRVCVCWFRRSLGNGSR